MKTLEKYYGALRDWTLIADAEAIDVTGIAKWFYEDNDRDKWAWNAYKDFPAITPPFPATWMEFHGVDTLRVNSQMHRFQDGAWSGAAAIARVEFDAQDAEASLRQNKMNDVISRVVGRPCTGRSPKYLTEIQAEADAGKRPRWGAILFLYVDGYRLVGPNLEAIGATYFYLDEHGAPIGRHVLPLIPLGKLHYATVQFPESHRLSQDLLRLVLHPFLFALSLMNAKNVSIVDAPPLPPAVAKKRERKGQPVLKFKTLHIEPMRARVKREKQEGQSEVKLALHLCRGHFKDYRDSGGLFGKYKGLYWWDSHVRGTEEAGRVIKDYELGKPKGA